VHLSVCVGGQISSSMDGPERGVLHSLSLVALPALSMPVPVVVASECDKALEECRASSSSGGGHASKAKLFLCLSNLFAILQTRDHVSAASDGHGAAAATDAARRTR
jgi:hypothetical protein